MPCTRPRRRSTPSSCVEANRWDSSCIERQALLFAAKARALRFPIAGFGAIPHDVGARKSVLMVWAAIGSWHRPTIGRLPAGLLRGPPGIRTPNLRIKSLVQRCRPQPREAIHLLVCVSVVPIVSHLFPFLHGDRTGTSPGGCCHRNRQLVKTPETSRTPSHGGGERRSEPSAED
jgi:hypothetical protein